LRDSSENIVPSVKSIEVRVPNSDRAKLTRKLWTILE